MINQGGKKANFGRIIVTLPRNLPRMKCFLVEGSVKLSGITSCAGSLGLEVILCIELNKARQLSVIRNKSCAT